MERTLIDCMRNLPLDESLPIVDSAVRADDVTPAALVQLADATRGRGRERIRRVSRMATGKAANAFESVCRAQAGLVPGLHVEAQHPVQVPGTSVVLHPDLADPVLKIAVECEGFEWHNGSRRADAGLSPLQPALPPGLAGHQVQLGAGDARPGVRARNAGERRRTGNMRMSREGSLRTSRAPTATFACPAATHTGPPTHTGPHRPTPAHPLPRPPTPPVSTTHPHPCPPPTPTPYVEKQTSGRQRHGHHQRHQGPAAGEGRPGRAVSSRSPGSAPGSRGRSGCGCSTARARSSRPGSRSRRAGWRRSASSRPRSRSRRHRAPGHRLRLQVFGDNPGQEPGRAATCARSR